MMMLVVVLLVVIAFAVAPDFMAGASCLAVGLGAIFAVLIAIAMAITW